MLWIWYCPGTDEQIKADCDAALVVLQRRGCSPDDAQRATFNAAELADDATDQTPAAAAVVAWYSAEEVAFKSIYDATGEWPHNATLVITGGDGHGG